MSGGANGDAGKERSQRPLPATAAAVQAATRSGFAGGRDGDHVVPREYLSLTLSFDHDVVEGAPAARFTARLKELIERGSILGEMLEPAAPHPG